MTKLLLIISCLLTGFFSTTSQAHPGHEDLAAHLKFAGGAIHAHVKWQESPPKLGVEQTLVVEFKRGTDHVATAAPGTLSVSLKKGNEDAKATGVVTALNGPDGKPVLGGYSVSGIKFAATGKWTVMITVTDAAAKAETQSFTTNVN